MFYLIFVFLFLAIRYVIHDKNSIRGRYLLLMMTAYIVAVFSLMFFLSKDTYYYNTVYSFFSMPAGIWKRMMLTPVGKSTWINLINLSCLFVLYFAVCFSLSFRPFENQRAEQWIRGLTAGVLVLEFIWYMPEISRRFYLWAYPDKLTYDGYLLVKNGVHLFTCGFNVGLILFSAVLLFVACRKASPLRLIRTNILAVSICFVLIMLSCYLSFCLLSALPDQGFAACGNRHLSLCAPAPRKPRDQDFSILSDGYLCAGCGEYVSDERNHEKDRAAHLFPDEKNRRLGHHLKGILSLYEK